MSDKHTPGPWKPVLNSSDYWKVVHPWPDQSFEEANSYSPTVVNVCTKEGDEQESNARLIAAAPELLEALSKFVAFTEQHGEVVFSGGGMSAIDVMNACTTKARAAIAKATGGAA